MNASGRCHVSYDDGDTEWITLAEQNWEVLSAKGQSHESPHSEKPHFKKTLNETRIINLCERNALDIGFE